jgi:hypothetical protein
MILISLSVKTGVPATRLSAKLPNDNIAQAALTIAHAMREALRSVFQPKGLAESSPGRSPGNSVPTAGKP